MAKFVETLSKKEVENMLYRLCVALASMKNENEMATLLRDLLSLQEARMIAKRLKIAELLQENLTFIEIQRKTKASTSTIARIHEWLRASGEGFRLASERTRRMHRKDTETDDLSSSWKGMKRRYPLYYWPELLLEEVIKTARSQERRRLQKVVRELEKAGEKTELFQQLRRIL